MRRATFVPRIRGHHVVPFLRMGGRSGLDAVGHVPLALTTKKDNVMKKPTKKPVKKPGSALAKLLGVSQPTYANLTKPQKLKRIDAALDKLEGKTTKAADSARRKLAFSKMAIKRSMGAGKKAPAKAKVKAKRNPRALFKLPKRGHPVEFEAHGKKFRAKKTHENTYMLTQIDPASRRSRWSDTAAELRQDVAYVMEHGAFPAAGGQSRSNPTKAKAPTKKAPAKRKVAAKRKAPTKAPAKRTVKLTKAQKAMVVAYFKQMRKHAAAQYPKMAKVQLLSDASVHDIPRHYATCKASRSTAAISIAPELAKLPKTQIAGVLMHEFGHMLLSMYGTHGTGSYDSKERAADRAAEKLFGTKIYYTARGVQTTGRGQRPRPAGLR